MKTFLPSKHSFTQIALGQAAHKLSHSIDTGISGFTKRQILPRIMSVALPIFSAIDTMYQATAFTLKFTANIITLHYLGRNYDSFSQNTMKQHLIKTAQYVAQTILGLPTALISPKYAYKMYQKDELDNFKDLSEKDPFDLLKTELMHITGNDLSSLPNFESILRERQASSEYQGLLDSLDSKMAAHVLGDPFIYKSGLEGNSMEKSISHFLRSLKDIKERHTTPTSPVALDQKNKDSIENLIQQLEGSHQLATRIIRIASNPGDKIAYQQLVKDITQSIHQLEKGEHKLIPFGWSGAPSGHAMMMQIQRKDNFFGSPQFSMTIYNTGEGAQNHAQYLKDGDELRFDPVLTFDGLTTTDLNHSFFEGSIESQIHSVWYSNDATYQYTSEDIYSKLFSTFEEKEVKVKNTPQFTTQGQFSGTCSYMCLKALARSNFRNDKLYKQTELESQLTHLIDLMVLLEQKKTRNPNVVKSIIERAYKTTAREVLKLWSPERKLIDENTVKRAYVILKTVQARVSPALTEPVDVAKDLSQINTQDFQVDFNKIKEEVSEVNRYHNCTEPSSSWVTPDTRSIQLYQFDTPTNYTEANVLLDEGLKQCLDLAAFGERSEAASIASQILLLFPNLEATDFWSKIQEPEEIRTLMEQLQQLSQFVVTMSASEEGVQNHNTHQTLVTFKNYFLSITLAKKLDPSFAHYNFSTTEFEKFCSSPGFLTTTPEINQEFEVLRRYARGLNKASQRKEIFAYPKKNSWESDLNYTFEESDINRQDELHYLSQLRIDARSRNFIIAQEMLSNKAYISSKLKKVSALFSAQKGSIKELVPYQFMRENYLLALASRQQETVRFYNSYDPKSEVKRVLSSHIKIEERDPLNRSELCPYGLRYNRYHNFRLERHKTPLSFNLATKDSEYKKVKELFSSTRTLKKIRHSKDLWRAESKSDTIEFENEIGIQADHSFDPEAKKDISSCLLKKELQVPLITQLFQKKEYLEKLGINAYQEGLFNSLFTPGLLAASLKKEPNLAYALLTLIEEGISHFSTNLGGRIQLQPCLFFMHLSLSLMPFIQEVKNARSPSQLLDIDCNAIIDQQIDTMKQWIKNVESETDKNAIRQVMVRYLLSTLPTKGPLPAQGSTERKRMEDNFLLLQTLQLEYSFEGTSKGFRNPLLEKEVYEGFLTRRKLFSEMIADPSYPDRIASEILKVAGFIVPPTDLVINSNDYPFLSGVFGSINFSFNLETSTLFTNNGRSITIPPSFRDDVVYKRFFGDRILRGGTLSSNQYEFDDKDGLGCVKFVQNVSGLKLYRKIGDDWYQQIKPPERSLQSLPSCLSEEETKDSIDKNKKAKHSFWVKCSKDSIYLWGTEKEEAERYNASLDLYIASANGKKLLFKTEKNRVRRLAEEGAKKERFVVNIKELNPIETSILKPLNNFVETSNSMIAYTTGDSNTIDEIEFPYYLNREGNPLSFFKRADGKLALLANPEYTICEDQSTAFVDPNFHNYLLIENRKGEKKLLLPCLNLREITSPLSKNITLDLNRREETSIHTLTINSRGKVEATSTETNAYLAYLYLAKKDYANAIKFLQQAKSFDRYSKHSLSIFQKIIELANKNKDLSSDAASIRLFAAYLCTKNLRETSGKALEEGELKKYFTKELPQKIFANYDLYLKLANDCSRKFRFETLVNNPDEEFSFLKWLVDEKERNPDLKEELIPPPVILRIHRFDPDFKPCKGFQKVSLDPNKFAKKIAPMPTSNVLDKYQLTRTYYDWDSIHLVNKRRYEPWKDLSTLLNNKWDSIQHPPARKSLLKESDVNFLTRIKTYYERVTNKNTSVRKKARFELEKMTFETNETAEFIRLFFIHLSYSPFYTTHLRTPNFPTTKSEIPTFVSSLTKIAQRFQSISTACKQISHLFNKTIKNYLVCSWVVSLFTLPPFISTMVTTLALAPYYYREIAFAWNSIKNKFNIETAFKKTFEQFSGIPGLIFSSNLTHKIAEKRIRTREGSSWKAPQSTSPQRISLNSSLIRSFPEQPLAKVYEEYFVATKKEENPKKQDLIDLSKIPATLPPYIRTRMALLNEDFQQGCQQNAAEVLYSLKDGKKLDDLTRILDTEKAKDLTQIERMEADIVSLANKHSSVWQQEVRRQCQTFGALKESLTIEACEHLFALNDEHAFKKANPFLDKSDIRRLYRKIALYSLIKSRFQQAERATGLIKEYTSTLVEIQSSTGDRKNMLEVQLADIEHKIGNTLASKRVFNPRKWPQLLIFESKMNKMLWKGQFKLIEEMFKYNEDGKYRDVIQQLIMGGGKTDVINGNQAFMKADRDHISMLVVLQSLFNTNKNDIMRTSMNCFGQDSMVLIYNRTPECFSIDYLEKLYRDLVLAREQRKNVIVPPASLHFLKHGYWEALDQLNKALSSNSQAELQELIDTKEFLRKILELVAAKGNATLDEPQKILAAAHEYNSPLGEGTPLNKDEMDLIGSIMMSIARTHSDLVDLRHQDQHLLSDEDVSTLQKKLVEEMATHKSLMLPATLQEGFKAYALSSDNKDPQALAFHKKMVEWSQSSDTSKKKALDLIALSKRILSGLLKECFQKRRPGVHFGLSQDKEQNPNLEIAIPYSGNKTPQENSRISCPYEMAIKTILSYFNVENQDDSERGLSKQQTQKWVLSIIDKARDEVDNSLHNRDLNLTNVGHFIKKFTGRDLLSFNPYDDEDLEEIRAHINDPSNPFGTQVIFDYLSTHVFPTVKTYQEQINTTAQDLSKLTKVSQAYAGTLENHLGFNSRYTTLTNSGTNGKTIDLLLRENDETHLVDQKSPHGLLQELLATNSHEYNALIDTGALFEGYSNEQVAQEILGFYQAQMPKRIRGVLYFHGDQLAMLKEGASQPIFIYNSDPESIKQVTDLDPEQYFGYFDDSHTTGANLPLYWKTKAYATISLGITKTKMLQGVKRLRGLDKKQRVTTLIPRCIEEKIRTSIGKPLGKLDIRDVVTFCEINESKELLQDNLRSCIQKMRFNMREFVHQKLIQAQNNDDLGLFQYYRKLIIDQVDNSPWQLYGSLNEEVPVQEHLKEVKNKYLSQAKRFFGRSEYALLKERMEAVIQEYEGALPEKIQRLSSVANTTMEQQVQEEVQREEEKEEERVSSCAFDRNTVLQQKSWAGTAIYQDACFSPAHRGFLSRFKTSSKPSLYALKSVLAESHKHAKYAAAIDANMLVSENFLKVVKEKGISLFDELSKNLHNVLAVKEGNEWKFVLLSVEEALFFQKELAKERGKPNTSPRKIWLLSPNGNLLQQGRDALTPHQNEAAFTRGIVQTLAFSGDLLALMKRRLSVQEWAKSQEKAKFSLLMDRLDRAKQKRFQKSKLYTCFPERVRASAAA